MGAEIGGPVFAKKRETWFGRNYAPEDVRRTRFGPEDGDIPSERPPWLSLPLEPVVRVGGCYYEYATEIWKCKWEDEGERNIHVGGTMVVTCLRMAWASRMHSAIWSG